MLTVGVGSRQALLFVLLKLLLPLALGLACLVGHRGLEMLELLGCGLLRMLHLLAHAPGLLVDRAALGSVALLFSLEERVVLLLLLVAPILEHFSLDLTNARIVEVGRAARVHILHHRIVLQLAEVFPFLLLSLNPARILAVGCFEPRSRLAIKIFRR